jgi:hypothetical protein
MQLQAKVHINAVLQHPFREISRRKPAENRRKMHTALDATPSQPFQGGAGIPVIFPRSDYEFYFISRGQGVDIGLEEAALLTASGALYIDNPHAPGIYRGYITASVCLKQNLIPPVKQTADQLRGFILQQRLSAGNLDARKAVEVNFFKKAAQREGGPLPPRIFGIAI